MERPADFRSDTLTQPTAAMRAAMAAAEVGDDVLGEDPTVRLLEERGAAFLGQDAAVFVPSGTMANQVAVHVHCRPGDELVCEERCHVFRFEGGGAARLSGVQVRTLPAAGGFPTPEQVREAVNSADPHFARSRLLVVENTHNMAGGLALGAPDLADLVAAARASGLEVHMDGARLVNAAVATGCAAADLGRQADSVSLCLSKGLGAPVGSLLAGGREFVEAARRARKAFGGGMRQAGVIAAAGLLALAEGPDLVARDHQRAQRLGEGLETVPGLRWQPAGITTNIVMIDTEAPARELVDCLARAGVLCMAVGAHRVRFVIHRDLADHHIDLCLETARSGAGEASKDRNDTA